MSNYLRLVLDARTAADLMTPNPRSLRDDALVKEAAAFLTDHGFSAAPVIDKGGRPIGVVSRADLVVHEREKVDYLPSAADSADAAEQTRAGQPLPRSGFQVEKTDLTPVRDIMTPVVFSVAPDTPAGTVVDEMLKLKVHRLFVIGDGVLVGVISALDILRRLRPAEVPTTAGGPGGQRHRTAAAV